jgi:hypothetical protein
MNEDNHKIESVERIVEAMAPALGIALTEESRIVVVSHLDIAFRMAQSVADFPLDDHEEPAPVFAP